MAQALLPGLQVPINPVSQPRMDPSYGSGVSQGLRRLGEAVDSIGETIYRAQERDQIAAGRIADADGYNKWRQGLATNPDYDTYIGAYDAWQPKHDSEVMKGITNPAAKKYMAEHLGLMKVARKDDVTTYARETAAKTIEANMRPRIEGLLRSSADLKEGDRLATEHIDSMADAIGPERVAFYKAYKDDQVAKLADEAEEKSVNALEDSMVDAGMKMGDEQRALETVAAIPSDRFGKYQAARGRAEQRIKLGYAIQEQQKKDANAKESADIVTGAWQLKYEDIGPLLERARANPELLPAVEKAIQITRELTKPVRTEVDTATTVKAMEQVRMAITRQRAGKASAADSMAVVVANATAFTPAQGAALVDDIYQAQKADDPMKTDLAKRGIEMLDGLKTAKYFGGDDAVSNQDKWLEATADYERWVKDHVDATPEQHQEHLRFLTTPVLMSWWKDMSPDQAWSGIRRLPPEAQREWVATKGVKSDEWLSRWRKIKKPLTLDVARHYWQRAGGDQAKAMAMAKEDGYAE